MNAEKVYIGEAGRSMQERIKEHDRDIRLARTQTSPISKQANKTGHHPLWNEVKFIDQDSHWYTRRVKEAIQIRLYSDADGTTESKFHKGGYQRPRNTAGDGDVSELQREQLQTGLLRKQL